MRLMRIIRHSSLFFDVILQADHAVIDLDIVDSSLRPCCATSDVNAFRWMSQSFFYLESSDVVPGVIQER